MTHLFLFLMLVIGSVQSSAPAEAALVTYQFTGTVTDVAPSLHTPGGLGANGFDMGLTLAGSYTFESTTPGYGPPPPPNSAGSSGVALYYGLMRSASLSLGNYVAMFETGGFSNSVIQLGNRASYAVDIGITGNLVKGSGPSVFSLNLTDETATAFSSVALPGAQAPNVNAFGHHQWSLLFWNGARVAGSLDTLTAVPLPSAIVLFGIALIALAGLMRSNKFVMRP